MTSQHDTTHFQCSPNAGGHSESSWECLAHPISISFYGLGTLRAAALVRSCDSTRCTSLKARTPTQRLSQGRASEQLREKRNSAMPLGGRLSNFQPVQSANHLVGTALQRFGSPERLHLASQNSWCQKPPNYTNCTCHPEYQMIRFTQPYAEFISPRARKPSITCDVYRFSYPEPQILKPQLWKASTIQPKPEMQ